MMKYCKPELTVRVSAVQAIQMHLKNDPINVETDNEPQTLTAYEADE